MWVDVALHSIFGSTVPAHLPLSSPTRLTCQDPRVVARYNQLFCAHIQHQLLAEKAFQLQRDMAHIPGDELQRRYDCIDTQRLRGMQYAEAHCRKLHMGAHAHSKEYSHAGKFVTAWKAILRRAKGEKVDSKYWRRCLRYVGWSSMLAPTVTEATNKVTEAFRQLRLFERTSITLRDSWFTELAKARAAEGNSSVHKEMLRIQREEKSRLDHRCVKRALGKAQVHRGLSLVSAPRNPDGTG